MATFCQPSPYNAWRASQGMREFFDSKRGKALFADFISCRKDYGWREDAPKTSWGDGGCSPFAVGTCMWLANSGVKARFIGVEYLDRPDSGHALVRIGNEYLDGVGIKSELPYGSRLRLDVPCEQITSPEMPIHYMAGTVSARVAKGLEAALGPADKLFCPGGAGFRGIRRHKSRRRR